MEKHKKVPVSSGNMKGRRRQGDGSQSVRDGNWQLWVEEGRAVGWEDTRGEEVLKEEGRQEADNGRHERVHRRLLSDRNV